MVLGIYLSLSTWFGDLNTVEQIFWGISIIFSVLFVIQFVFSLIGFDFDTDVDADVSGGDYSLDTDFTVFSVRSIIAFFTFFGWTGVLVLRSGAGAGAAVGFGLLAGTVAMLIVAYMFYLFMKLTKDGNVDLSEALYNTGEVYLTIPSDKSGQGKIHIQIQGILKEMDAISDGKALATGVPVRVVDILNNNILVVEPVETYLPSGND